MLVLYRYTELLKVIELTYRDLKNFGGDLNEIKKVRTFRPKKVEEKNYKIRIAWGNYVLWPEYEELLLSGGDLNKLTENCSVKLRFIPKNNSFRTQNSSIKTEGLDEGQQKL